MAQLKVRELGDYIREQRRGAQISLRQLARLAGVSNPYLSQIERGLRRPSAEILQQIAKALRISAEALYVQAGILEEREGDTDFPSAVFRDASITERQKHVLLEIYDSFRRENDSKADPTDASDVPAAPSDASGVAEPAATAQRPRSASTRSPSAKTSKTNKTSKTSDTSKPSLTAKAGTASKSARSTASKPASAAGRRTKANPAAGNTTEAVG